MIYEGRELVELKFDTMQHWPDGKELLVKDYKGEATKRSMRIYEPKARNPWIWLDSNGVWGAEDTAYELPVRKMRRVTRAYCAGKTVITNNGTMLYNYGAGNERAMKWWNDPMPDEYVKLADSLPDALAGNWLPMEVEG